MRVAGGLLPTRAVDEGSSLCQRAAVGGVGGFGAHVCGGSEASAHVFGGLGTLVPRSGVVGESGELVGADARAHQRYIVSTHMMEYCFLTEEVKISMFSVF